MNASAPADAKICSKASCASACIFVIRGCMFLLSLTATCQVWTVSLKAGQSTYNLFVGRSLGKTQRSCGRRLTAGCSAGRGARARQRLGRTRASSSSPEGTSARALAGRRARLLEDILARRIATGPAAAAFGMSEPPAGLLVPVPGSGGRQGRLEAGIDPAVLDVDPGRAERQQGLAAKEPLHRK